MESHPHHGKKVLFVDHAGKKEPATITGVWPDKTVTLMTESGLTVDNVQVVQQGQEANRTCSLVAG